MTEDFNEVSGKICHSKSGLYYFCLVYDDGVVKGFMQVKEREVKKLFVEPVLQGNGIGAELLDYAIDQKNVNFLWVLEKNKRAMAFYKRHGFVETNEKKYEEDTTEFLVCMKRFSDFE